MSKLSQISLVEASDEQLQWFGANVLGLDMTGLKTRTKLMGAIGPAWDRDTISVPAEADATEQTEAPVVAVDPKNDYSSVMDAPTITVKLLTNGGVPGGKDDVFVSVNTRNLRFARNMPVKMPYPFFDAIVNAVCADVSQDENNELIETEVHRYPYQVLEPVDPVALAAFRAATDQQFLYR